MSAADAKQARIAPDTNKENVKKSHAAGILREAREEQHREFQQALHDVHFVKDPRASTDAIAADPLSPNVQRVMQWIKNRSWGNLSLYCVGDDRKPASAADCMRDLKMAKSTVYRCMDYLAARGYVQCHGPSKKLYPIIAPTIGLSPIRVENKSGFAQFMESWRIAHSSEVHEAELGRATCERVRRQALAEYRQMRQAERKNGAPPKPESLAPPVPFPAPELAPEIMTAFEDAVPAEKPFSPRSAAELVRDVRADFARQGETFSDAEIAGAIGAAAAAAGHRVRNFGFFKTALAEKLEALISVRRREKARAAELATKCPDCKGSGRDRILPQETCLECGGHGIPVEKIQCPQCAGTGWKIHGEELCKPCRGRGLTAPPLSR